MPATCDDVRSRLARDPARPALITAAGDIVDHGELLRRAAEWGERLGPDRRLVFLQARNDAESVSAYLACLLGGHPVYLYAGQPDDPLQALAERYRPDVVIGAGRDMDWRDGGQARALHPSLAVLLSTSGTTGSPKFVKLSLSNIVANADSIAEYLHIGTADRAMTSLSFAYSYGMSVVNSHLLAGGSLLLDDASVTDPAFWTRFRDGAATSFAGVPYTFEMLSIADPGWAEIPGLRHVTQAGGALSPDRVRHFAALGELHGWRFYVMYGQTECAPRISYLPPEQAQAHPACIGVPVPGGRIDLIDEDGARIDAPDTPGELVYSGPNVMMGYAEGAAALATDETPSAHRTGDIACRNEAGLFYIAGRLSRFVKPFGLRVNLDELQATLAGDHPGTVCTGTDEVIVVAREGGGAGGGEAGDAALLDMLSRRLKLPPATFRILHVAAIPRLSSGKVDYRAILAAAAAADAGSGGAHPGNLLRRVLSVDFVRRVFVEAGQILGLRTGQWRGVRHIFATLLNVSAVGGQDTFVSLAGDSLSYVQTSIALEEYLGHLPAGWEQMTVDELEQEGPVEQTF